MTKKVKPHESIQLIRFASGISLKQIDLIVRTSEFTVKKMWAYFRVIRVRVCYYWKMFELRKVMINIIYLHVIVIICLVFFFFIDEKYFNIVFISFVVERIRA